MSEEPKEVTIKRLKTMLIPSARHAVINATTEESKKHFLKLLEERTKKLAQLETRSKLEKL